MSDAINEPRPLPSQALARQIIEALGQNGTPPARGVQYFNMGNADLLNTLEKHYLETYLQQGGAVFKLVVGDYGAGKSHFLYCVRDLGWKHHYAVSKVDLSPRETPYDDQKKIYAAVAQNILVQADTSRALEAELSEDDEPVRGLTGLLKALLQAEASRNGLHITDEKARKLPDIQAIQESYSNTTIDSMSYQRAILTYFDAVLYDDAMLTESLTRWLHGEDITPEDFKAIKVYGVTEKINKNNAFKMLRSLCQTIRALHYNGLVLLFDEGDRMMSVTKRAEKVVTDNLREVIDRCRDELPGAMFLYAVPPAFMNEVVKNYPALQQRVESPAKFSSINPFSPEINLEKLDMPEEELLSGIAEKLLPIFEIAYAVQFDHALQSRNVAVLVDDAVRSRLATNQRRLFVKALVAEWYQQKEQGERTLNASDAARLIRGQDEPDNTAAASTDGEAR